MLHIVGELEARDYYIWTKVTYKRMLIKFMTWLYDAKEKPDVISWIKVQNVKSRRLPEELLTFNLKVTPEEVINMLKKMSREGLIQEVKHDYWQIV